VTDLKKVSNRFETLKEKVGERERREILTKPIFWVLDLWHLDGGLVCVVETWKRK
jgi:hypothetical protein